jgi:hypothetical protein
LKSLAGTTENVPPLCQESEGLSLITHLSDSILPINALRGQNVRSIT